MTMPPVIAKPAVPLQRPEAPRPMFSALAIASSGLSAQRARMEVIAQNLANAETTRTPQGGPYQRQTVSLQATQPQNEGLNAQIGQSIIAGMPAPPVPAVPPIVPLNQSVLGTGTTQPTGAVQVAAIGTDKSEGSMVYDPGHPDADKNGYVHMPNVSVTDEMIDLMNARRVYEANATVFQVARTMLHKAIDI
jgi:flagellar basal-body rod protein FlgC